MKTKISNNEIGRASTFMVMSDFILNGYKAIVTDEAFPYDIVVEIDGEFKKIQVKSLTKKTKLQVNQKTQFYNFVMKQGRGSGKPYKNNQVDGFALVMLDIKQIAYLSKKGFDGWSVSLCDKEEIRRGRRNSNLSRRRFWQDMTLDNLIKNI